jgi:outer membrane lipoprotein-sorting protein
MNRLVAFAVFMSIALSAGLRIPAGVQTPAPPADEILDKVDRNAVAGNKIVVSEMIIHGRRDSRSIKAKSWVMGDEKAFTEYLEPPREKGVKMLKLGDQLWTYSPDADRTIAISGHMLRQSVMGSDLSYEDMMEDRKLRNAYEAKVTAEERILDRPCWVLELVSKSGATAYYSRKIWVDKERFLALKEERYAKSGKLLKTLEVRAVARMGGRWVPTSAVFKDVLKQGQGTEWRIESVEFDAAIPDALFTKASLRK